MSVRERFVRVRVRVDSNRGRVGEPATVAVLVASGAADRRRRAAMACRAVLRDGLPKSPKSSTWQPSLGFGIVRIVGGGVRGVVDARVGGVGGRGRRRRRRARERRDVRGGVPRRISREVRPRASTATFRGELLPAAAPLAATAGREAAAPRPPTRTARASPTARRLRRRRADWRGGATETAFFRAAIEPFASDPNLDAKTTRRLARLAPLTLPADPTASAAFVRACAKRAGDAIAKRDGPIAGAPLLLYAACFASEASAASNDPCARERGRHGTRRARVGDGQGRPDCSRRFGNWQNERRRRRRRGGRRALRKRGRWWWWCSFRLGGGGGGVRARRGGVGRRGD